jgi:hypothetical protein
LSLSIQCLVYFLGIRRNYRTCRHSKRCGFDMRFWQKSVFFRFFGIGFDLPTSWRGRFRYPLYYRYTTFGSLAPHFCFVYKCGYLRALLFMFGASIPCGILLFWQLLFLLFLLHFFFLFTGCWLESSVRVFSFFREVFVLFSF